MKVPGGTGDLHLDWVWCLTQIPVFIPLLNTVGALTCTVPVLVPSELSTT